MGNSHSHSRPYGYSYGSQNLQQRPYYGGSGLGYGEQLSMYQYYPSQQYARSYRHGRRHHHHPHHQHGSHGGYGQSYYPSASGVGGGGGGMYPGMVPAATPSYGYRGSPYRY